MNEVDHVYSALYETAQYTYIEREERVPNNKIKLGVFTRRGNYYE